MSENKQAATHSRSFLLEVIILPWLFLTVTLAGGVRIEKETGDVLFLHPHLVLLLLGAIMMVPLYRNGFLVWMWKQNRPSLISTLSRLLLVTVLYLSSVQLLNLLTPERGFFFLIFVLVYSLVFLSNLVALWNPHRLLKSLAIFLTACFALKYLLLGELFSPGEGWLFYFFQQFFQAATLGTLNYEVHSPLTGYLALMTLSLYLLGLYLAAPPREWSQRLVLEVFAREYLSPSQRNRLRRALQSGEPADSAPERKLEERF